MWRIVMLALAACGDSSEGSVRDLDRDGFETPEDCDDGDGSVYPTAAEVPYDEVDQDCSGADLVDVDFDGFDAVAAGGADCDDEDPGVRPTADEVAYDGVDQDCSGGDITDLDSDGYDAIEAGGDDCDDNDPGAFPGAADGYGDDIDRDCSGADGTDGDGDGWPSAEPGGQGRDCDDADPSINPDATDVLFDGIDQDCRGDCDYDADHDGAVPPEWVDAVTDGTPCDDDGSMNVRVLVDCDDTDPLASTQVVDSVTPADGAVGVGAQTRIQVRLVDREFDATARLLEPDGTEVWTSFTNGGNDLFLSRINEASGYAGYPLDAFTTYTIEIHHSCGTEITTFTTGNGLAPVAPADLVGTTWATSPSGIQSSGFAVTAYLPFDTNIALLGVTGTDGTNLDLIIAASDPSGGQNLCVPTGEIVGADFSGNPALTAAPLDVPMRFFTFGGTEVPIVHQQGRIETTLLGGNLLELWVSGLVDVRPVADASGIGVNGLCNAWGGCVACPDGTGATCLFEELWLKDNIMQPVAQTIVPRTAGDIALDPTCP